MADQINDKPALGIGVTQVPNQSTKYTMRLIDRFNNPPAAAIVKQEDSNKVTLQIGFDVPSSKVPGDTKSTGAPNICLLPFNEISRDGDKITGEIPTKLISVKAQYTPAVMDGDNVSVTGFATFFITFDLGEVQIISA